jgi:hypothetical protein
MSVREVIMQDLLPQTEDKNGHAMLETDYFSLIRSDR